MTREITLSPDYDSPCGLWADEESFDLPKGSLPDASNLHISPDLTHDLIAWNEAWARNFGDAPQGSEYSWNKSFNVLDWITKGDEISNRLEEEIDDTIVNRLYRSYGECPSSWGP